MRFFIITGRRHIGKTTFVKQLIEELKEFYTIGGLLTVGVKEKMFLNLKNDKSFPYYQSNEIIKDQIGDYKISEKAIMFAEEALKKASDVKLAIIDEFGRLEREKRGLYEGVKKLVELIRDKQETVLLMIVQIDVIEDAKVLLELEPEKIWELKKDSSNEKVKFEIKKMIEN